MATTRLIPMHKVKNQSTEKGRAANTPRLLP